MYGCVEDPWDLDAGVHIPAHLSWEELGLSHLPKPEDDEDCAEDDNYVIPDGMEEHEPYEELGEESEENSAVYCACSEGKCNGADARSSQAGVALLSFVLISVSFVAN